MRPVDVYQYGAPGGARAPMPRISGGGKHLWRCEGLRTENESLDLALTVLRVPYSLDIGATELILKMVFLNTELNLTP